MLTESKAAFARRLGINKSTVTRAAQAGRLVLDGDKVLIDASLARWTATMGGRTDVAERHAQQRGHSLESLPKAGNGANNATVAASGGVLPDLNDVADTQSAAQPGNADGRTRYKTLTLQYENEAIKLEMALRRGLRHPLADVRREAHGLGVALRASMERLIDQTAPRLAAEQRPEARAALLKAECVAMARGLRLEFVRALRRLRQKPKGVQAQ